MITDMLILAIIYYLFLDFLVPFLSGAQICILQGTRLIGILKKEVIS